MEEWQCLDFELSDILIPPELLKAKSLKNFNYSLAKWIKEEITVEETSESKPTASRYDDLLAGLNEEETKIIN